MQKRIAARCVCLPLPWLEDSRPLLLLALNANDLHLALTTARTAVIGFMLVGTARRLVEDPLYYYLGGGRCKLDPGLKAPWFQKFNLLK